MCIKVNLACDLWERSVYAVSDKCTGRARINRDDFRLKQQLFLREYRTLKCTVSNQSIDDTDIKPEPHIWDLGI